MRSLLLFLSTLLLTSISFGQPPQVEGIKLGMSWTQAETVMERKDCMMKDMTSVYRYVTECRGEGVLLISAKRDAFPSKEESKVQGIEYLLSSGDLVETYNEYKKRWSDMMGWNSPEKRSSTYYWTWEADTLTAGITYSEPNSIPQNVAITLRRP